MGLKVRAHSLKKRGKKKEKEKSKKKSREEKVPTKNMAAKPSQNLGGFLGELKRIQPGGKARSPYRKEKEVS